MKDVYTYLFNTDSYSIHDINEPRYKYTLEDIKNLPTLDIGSGRGYLLQFIKEQYPDIELTSLDYDKYHDVDCDFYSIDLELDSVSQYRANQIICLDVLEHLTEESSLKLLADIANIGEDAFISIAFHNDVLEVNNIPTELHINLHSVEWWEENLNKYFIIERKELLYNGLAIYYHLKSRRYYES